VIEQLEVTLLEPEQREFEARSTDNMDAYNAYLRGLSYSFVQDRENVDRAVEMFERAVSLDPDFALAYALLSEQRAFAYAQGWDRSQRGLAQAKDAADRALEIDPDLPEVHRALGWYYDRCHQDYERALKEYSVAANVRPNDGELLGYIALVHRRQGQSQEAVTVAEEAVELDPQSYNNLFTLANAYSFERRHQEAAEMIDRAIAVAPDRPGAYIYKWRIYYRWYGPSPQSRQVLQETPKNMPNLEFRWAVQEMGERNWEAALEWLARDPQGPGSGWECFCYFSMNQPERTRETCEAERIALEKARTERPESSTTYSRLGGIYAVLGRKEDAIRAGERSVALMPVSKNAVNGQYRLIELAWTYAATGELDAALDQVEYLLSTPGHLTVAQLRLEPYWDPLRDHPRFQEILEKYRSDDAAVQ
jgi:tetratricopeptide (TPR) repeat protein